MLGVVRVKEPKATSNSAIRLSSGQVTLYTKEEHQMSE
jgi:hypothetical protein